MARSITIRFRDWIPKLEDIVTWCEKQDGAYVIGLEMGNHYQIGIASESRTNNIRRSLERYLYKLYVEARHEKNWKTALCIREHNDWEYLVGYCQKENMVATNMDAIALEEGRKNYEKFKSLKKEIKTEKDRKLSADQVVEKYIEFLIEHHLKPTMETQTRFFEHIYESGKVAFSTYQRINKLTLQAWACIALKIPNEYGFDSGTQR